MKKLVPASQITALLTKASNRPVTTPEAPAGFTYEQAVDILFEECPGVKEEFSGRSLPDTIADGLTSYISAISSTPPDPAEAKRSRAALKLELLEIQEDEVSVTAALDNIAQAALAASTKKAPPDGEVTPLVRRDQKAALANLSSKENVIKAIERSAADKMDAIREAHIKIHTGDTAAADALTKLAKSYRAGKTGESATDLLNLIADAAMAGKTPQAFAAGDFAELTVQVTKTLKKKLGNNGALADKVAKEAVLAAASEVTAPLVGKVSVG